MQLSGEGGGGGCPITPLPLPHTAQPTTRHGMYATTQTQAISKQDPGGNANCPGQGGQGAVQSKQHLMELQIGHATN